MDPIPGAHFRDTNPGVLLEVSRDNDVLIRNDTGCRNVEGHRHFEDDFRMSDRPTLYPMDRLGRFFRIAFGCARIDPVYDAANVFGRETAIVCEMADGGIGKPGRHLA